jgi:hypothetical protein
LISVYDKVDSKEVDSRYGSTTTYDKDLPSIDSVMGR